MPLLSVDVQGAMTAMQYVFLSFWKMEAWIGRWWSREGKRMMADMFSTLDI